MWEGKLGQGGQGLIALCLFVPFILFSGWAGPLADRYSKRSISVLMKWVEIPLAMIAGIGFGTHNFWLAACAMVFLATQSTFFSPAKYGMIPEIVSENNVARANGFLNMTTNIAIIAGIVGGGILSDQMELYSGNLQVWLPGIVLSSVAILGLFSIVCLPELQPMNIRTSVPLNPFATYIATGKTMCQSILMKVAIAWALFYLLATTVLLILQELGSVLHVSDAMISYLQGTAGVCIGLGSMLAGFVSRRQIRLSLSKYASLGMALSVLFIGIVPISYWTVLGGLILLGFTTGFYVIPLQTLMQTMPSAAKRGQVLATSNAIFLFVYGDWLIVVLDTTPTFWRITTMDFFLFVLELEFLHG